MAHQSSWLAQLSIANAKPLYVLAPHLDDAAWSMGALLQSAAGHGHPVHIVSIFSLSPSVYQSLQPPAGATTLRKAEDARAARLVGAASSIRLDFPDVVLRDRSAVEIFSPGYKMLPPLKELLLKALSAVVPADAVLFAPLAVGSHADHLATREAATLLSCERLCFYEDLPYIARDGGAIEQVQAFIKKHQLQEYRTRLNPPQIEQHLRIFETYKTQRTDSDAQKMRTFITEKGLGIWAPQES